MVTYVQIGKKPRMAYNGTMANIRNDFVEQFYTQKWKKIVPIFFYSSPTSTEYVGLLIPKVDKVGGRVYSRLYWITQSEYWSIDKGGIKQKVRYNHEFEDISEAFNQYKKEGYNVN